MFLQCITIIGSRLCQTCTQFYKHHDCYYIPCTPHVYVLGNICTMPEGMRMQCREQSAYLCHSTGRGGV